MTQLPEIRPLRSLAVATIFIGLLGVALTPLYLYVESVNRPIVVRLGAALVVGMALLRLRRLVKARLERQDPSSFDRALRQEPAVRHSATLFLTAEPSAIQRGRPAVLCARALAADAGAVCAPSRGATGGEIPDADWPPPAQARALPDHPTESHHGPRGALMTLDMLANRCQDILAALTQVIVGKEAVLQRILAGILCNGHILIEDYPGLAKTLIAQLFAQAVGLDFKRIQFTPDLLPSDITGSFLYDQREGRFEFRRGPVFTNLLLADEINRATPKTQAALLEAMQEAQVTIEGERFVLEPPFLVVATQNPIEMEGTYPLPEAQLDRFLMRLGVGYPDPDEEREILTRRRQRRQDAACVPKVVSREELLAMQGALEDIFVSTPIERYIVDLVQATRADGRVAVGASPRGGLALLKLARAQAGLQRRDFVTPDDVKGIAIAALAHRVILRPELWASKVTPVQVVSDILSRVPTPKAETE